MTPPRLELAERQRGLKAVERLLDRLKREGLGPVGIQFLLRAGQQWPKPLGYKDIGTDLEHSWTENAKRLQARGLVTYTPGHTAGQRSSITLTPCGKRLLGL